MKVTCGLIDGDYNMHAEVGTFLTFEHINVTVGSSNSVVSNRIS